MALRVIGTRRLLWLVRWCLHRREIALAPFVESQVGLSLLHGSPLGRTLVGPQRDAQLPHLVDENVRRILRGRRARACTPTRAVVVAVCLAIPPAVNQPRCRLGHGALQPRHLRLWHREQAEQRRAGVWTQRASVARSRQWVAARKVDEHRGAHAVPMRGPESLLPRVHEDRYAARGDLEM